MGLSGETVVMNFSDVYAEQTFWRDGAGAAGENPPVCRLDCRDIPGTNCYCDEAAAVKLRRRMSGRGRSGVRFLDSGNYHYLTKLWLEQQEEDFDLLVFDHHTDLQLPMFGALLSCGGWIRTALEEIPRLHRVYLAGPPEGAWQEALSDLPPELAGRVFWTDEAGLADAAGFAAFLNGAEKKAEGCLPLCLSIDKDILAPAEAPTNWDQGEVSLPLLLERLRQAAGLRRILSADICGENPEGRDGPAAAAERLASSAVNAALLQVLRE